MEDNVDSEVTGEALAIIISALRNYPLGAVDSCTNAENAYGILQVMYAGKTVTNKIRVLNGSLNMRMEREG